LQQKKLPQKQVSKFNARSASESIVKPKIVRKSKNVDTTSVSINREVDISISESSLKTKTARKQITSNIKTNLEISGSSQDVLKQKQSRKLKEAIRSQPNNDNIEQTMHRSSNDLSSETSDSDIQSRYKPHPYDTNDDDDECIDRDYLTSGDEITDAYDLDMIRLYLELNEKGLLGSDGEPIEWSENEEEFT